MIREVEKPKIKEIFKRAGTDKAVPPELSNLEMVGSGKGAIALTLEYLKAKKIITDKTDEILVPGWLGYWVYNQMQPYIFPVKKFTEKTKIIFVYHQYGFPQDMDKIMEFAREKKLIVIEDCAHALASSYKGKPLGNFGDFAIYSFSKWFFCFALGGVKTNDADFKSFAKESLDHSSRSLALFKDTVKLISEHSLFSRSKKYQNFSRHLLNMSYGVYGQAVRPGGLAKKLFREKISQEITLRQKRYGFFLRETSGLGLCDHLEKEGITPYIIPIKAAGEAADRLLTALKDNGFSTGRYYFDFNRNLLNPDFKPVIWIPCHGGMSESRFCALTELIVKTVKN